MEVVSCDMWYFEFECVWYVKVVGREEIWEFYGVE